MESPRLFLSQQDPFFNAAFNAHCSFEFWQPEMRQLLAKNGIGGDDSSGSLGRLSQLSDLPSSHRREYIAWIPEAKRDETR